MPGSRSYRYATLICSLPSHGSLSEIRQTPLSRIRLWQRLKNMLDLEDYRCLVRAVDLLEWHHHPMEESDFDFLERIHREIDHLHHPFLRDLATWRLELRSLVAALRHRNAGLTTPPQVPWGYGRWLPAIRRNWNQEFFGLEKAHPWLKEGHRLLREENAHDFEKLLLKVVWDHLDRLSIDHVFDFEAVTIYVQRWDLIDRWIRYRPAQALDRFDSLVQAGLAPVSQGI
ncbi:MAG: DUF2764 family protein [Methylohalobius sp. ZOD2]